MRHNIDFFNGGFYHVYNRGSDKRNVVVDLADRNRFMKTLVASNDNSGSVRKHSIGRGVAVVSHDPFVKVHAFILLDNHYHFLVEQLVDWGVSKFFGRIGNGYTKYFNKKYNRTGVLFEGPFKARSVVSDVYFMHLVRYIHLNALDRDMPQWRVEGATDWLQAVHLMKRHKWSSFGAFLNTPSIPEFVSTEMMLKMIGGQDESLMFH